MVNTLVTLVSIAFYGLVMGLVFPWMDSLYTKRCKKCRGGASCYADHELVAFFSGLLWPAGLPIAIGLCFDRNSREEIRRNEELTEAKHRARVAEELERESRALDRMLGR